MNVSLRHKTEEDLQFYTGRVYGDMKDSEKGLESEKLFGRSGLDKKSFTMFKVDEQEKMRGFIPLTLPIANQLKMHYLNSILQISSNTIRDILDFRLCVNNEDCDILNLKEVTNPALVSVGPQALIKLIDQLDLEEELINSLEFKLGAGSRVNKVGNGQHIIGEYYCTGATVSSLERLHESMLKLENREVLLYNIASKASLYGMFIKDMVVMPLIYRPQIDSRKDPLTHMYSKVVMKNLELEAIKDSRDFRFDSFCQKYKELQVAVSNCIVKNTDMRNKDKVLSIADRIKGKTGIIRGKMEGKRQDYSGRSVITINPELAIDEVGIPMEMIPKLYQYHWLKRLKVKNAESIKKILNVRPKDLKWCLKELQSLGVLKDIPTILNRAPSLGALSLQGYTCIPVEGRAIQVPALLCQAYNADFDGDQMAAHVPMGDEAVYEAKTIMSPLNNPLHSATGEIVLKPRHEILLGLYICTKDYSESDKESKNVSSSNAYDDVVKNKIKIYDTIGGMTAGWRAFLDCFPKGSVDHLPKNVITKKNIDDWMFPLIDSGPENMKEGLTKLVKLGFEIATLYAPTIDLYGLEKIDNIKKPMAEFQETMDDVVELYNNGFMNDEEFNRVFDEKNSILNKTVIRMLEEEVLDKDECFSQLVKSGARGDTSNLVQMYAMKGVVRRSNTEAFSVIIENSFRSGLTPLESYISAYGARSDLITKGQGPKQTGYASRLMSHVAADVVIREEDCGTNSFLLVDKAEISNHIVNSDDKKKERVVLEVMKEIILGRYEGRTNIYINESNINDYLTRDVVEIRSVLTCKVAACAKCYGYDIGRRKPEAPVGHPIGVIAAQGIGSLATQLSMDTFHTGGVVGSSPTIASAFDRMDSLIKMTDISTSKKFEMYDPLAWASGEVKTVQISNKHVHVYIGNNTKIKAKMPVGVALKSVVEQGESICLNRGDIFTKEMLRYHGMEDTQRDLLYEMYFAYRAKSSLNIKNFECLIDSMTLYLALESDDKIRAGKFYSKQELYHSNSKVKTIATLKGVREALLSKANLMANIELENVVKGLSRAVLVQNVDDGSSIIGSLMMGEVPNIGSQMNPRYIAERLL